MKVVITKKAEKDLVKLDAFTRKRIITELLELEISLIGKEIKKLSGIPNTWRLRIGNYRIILEVIKGKAIILSFTYWTSAENIPIIKKTREHVKKQTELSLLHLNRGANSGGENV